MNDRDLEAAVRERYAAHAERPTPLALRELVLAIPAQASARERSATLTHPRRARLRSTLMLAAMLVVAGAAAALVASSPLLRPSPIPAERGVFVSTSALPSAPHDGWAAVLLGDGTVLVMGGYDSGGAAFTWDPHTEVWSAAGTMSRESEQMGTPVILDRGRILVPYEGTADLWDPATRTFSPVRELEALGGPFTATLESDGRLLCVSARSAFLWDPSSRSMTATTMPPRPPFEPAGTRLSNGSILVLNAALPQVGIVAATWDPRTERFTPTGQPLEPRTGETTAVLRDGRVLVAGGVGPTVRHVPIAREPGLASAEIWDPSTGLFSATGSRDIAGWWPITLTPLPDGHVLAVGQDGDVELFELK